MNRIIIDYFSLTSAIHGVGAIKSLLGFGEGEDPFILSDKGAGHGYSKREYFSGISIMYEPGETQRFKVWLEMTGSGCRTFETLGSGDWELLFRVGLMDPQNVHVTRLDVAYDDRPIEYDDFMQMEPEERAGKYNGILNIKRINHDVMSHNWVSSSRLRSWDAHYSSSGMSSYIGNQLNGDMLLRIYDKAQERGCADDYHWVRVEMQMRRDRAMGFLKADGSVPHRFQGVLANYLRFVIPGKNDSNRSRWRTAPYWEKVLGDVGRIKIYDKPGMDYNELHLEKMVTHRDGNALWTYIKIYGVEHFLETLEKNRPKVVNPKYKMLLKKCGEFDAAAQLIEDAARRAELDEAADEMVREALRDHFFREQVAKAYREKGRTLEAAQLYDEDAWQKKSSKNKTFLDEHQRFVKVLNAQRDNFLTRQALKKL